MTRTERKSMGRLLPTLFMTLTLAAVRPVPAQERYEVSGREIALYNLAGEMTLAPGRGTAVQVEVTRRGAGGPELTVERGPVRGRETLRVIYPADEIRYAPEQASYGTELRVRDDGTFGDEDGDDWRRRSGRRVRVSSRRGLEAWADVRVLVPEGQHIAVYLAAGRLSATNVNGTLRLDAASATVVASGITGPLTVDVGSGNVSLRDVTGDVDVDTGSGDVDVTGVRGDRFRIDTGSGTATARDVTASALEIDTGSGDVDLSAASARDVVLDTGSGAVRCSFTSSPSTLDVDTGSGSVTITLPASYGAAVDIESGSGGVELDFPVQTRRLARDHVSGSIGDGRGTLRVDTGSGRVRILRGQ
ncbi:MAG TPA: DUF4097 family beta strand repeat-containing protein [Gemmatimonadales bacterium]|nr:DUF4097 family beta strand repeat-containing protein [Gemmatimonadales bacterium]